MADFGSIAKEVFDVLRSYNYKVILYDEGDMEISEPEEARRMYSPEHNLNVKLSEDEDDSSVTLTLGKHTKAGKVMGLIQSLRSAATKYNMTFSVENENANIEPKQDSQLASISEEDTRMEVYEGMYGTSKSSYLRLENARMIVRHKRRIDDSKIGARSRQIESIFVENAAGERMLLPGTQLAPGRAMTQHVNQGGTWGDPVGQQITEMATEYANLGIASQHIGSMPLSETVTAVREACRAKMKKLRKTFEQLYRPSSYAAEAADIAAQANMLTETDDGIDEAHLAEVRQMLNDAELPPEVSECACRAMKDSVKEDANTVGVFNYRVSADVWANLDKGKIALRGRPVFDKHQFKSVVSELIYRLGQIVPHVQDDALANALSYVADNLTDGPNKRELATVALKALKAAKHQAISPEVKEEPLDVGGNMIDVTIGDERRPINAAIWQDLQRGRIKLTGKPRFDRHKFTNVVAELVYRLGQIVPTVEDDRLANILASIADRLPEVDRKAKQPLFKIGADALKAAAAFVHDQKADKLADNNPVISEHQAWLDQFTPERILVDGFDPSNTMNPYHPAHESYDGLIDKAIGSFDPKYFVDQVAHEFDPKDPHENELPPDDVRDRVWEMMRQELVYAMDELGMDPDAAIKQATDAVYDEAIRALRERGFVIHDVGVQESALEEEELTREDILLPPKNMGDDLAGEVSKATVSDIDDPDKEKQPDHNYVSRLKILAGMNSNSNSASY